MRFRSHRSQGEEPGVNLTPLIDVVFLLLIFFMVSTTFDRTSDLEIELPTADARAPASPPDALVVGIDAAGRFSVNGEILAATDPDTLRTALLAVAGEDRQQAFIIEADGDAAHQRVVTVMDVAGQLGFARLAIATLTSTSGDR